MTGRLTSDAVWVIAADPSPQPRAMSITVAGAPARPAEVVFEQRRLVLQGAGSTI
ncbi:MAG: hypothetical protein M5U09_25325 [Gammaproteobacteria bacterium]|nr:hypothetical protein [Gammaproteobacteria bacterium]